MVMVGPLPDTPLLHQQRPRRNGVYFFAGIALVALSAGVCVIRRRQIELMRENPKEFGHHYKSHQYEKSGMSSIHEHTDSTINREGKFQRLIGQRSGLPEKLIVCYADWGQCDDTVTRAAIQGCNVIIWFSINILLDPRTGLPKTNGSCPNLHCVANVSHYLQTHNIATTHLISIGGWNAPHPDANLDPAVAWEHWKRWNAEVVAKTELDFEGFDGIDWDLEGNDNPKSPYNTFAQQTLDFMGKFSQLAKYDGYIVSMAPAESYMDVETSLFDRSLLHDYPEWEGIVDFRYHGRNCYAYVLATYGRTDVKDQTSVPTFDFISVQLYESYSHANFAITQAGVPAHLYLASYVAKLAAGWEVDLNLDSTALPLKVQVDTTQLVIGVGNAWAGHGDLPPALYIPPDALHQAWRRLSDAGLAPRGFMFWSIRSEGRTPPGGSAPLYMAAELNGFLGTRRPG